MTNERLEIKVNKYNIEVANKLREISVLLKAQNANPFRVKAYLNAALTLEKLPSDVKSITRKKGLKGLVELPSIGIGIADSILEYIAVGRMSRLDNLLGSPGSINLLKNIPTIGRELAIRIDEKLHIESIEQLEDALLSGKLEKVDGVGRKRLEAIEDWLLRYFGKSQQKISTDKGIRVKPAIELLLDIDSEYRRKSKANQLKVISPRRFNPEQKKWLPIFHCFREGWHFTALYSNTERAHKLNKVFDWVVIYYYDDEHREGQQTIVTESRGSLKGKRIVRGREDECRRYYEAHRFAESA